MGTTHYTFFNDEWNKEDDTDEDDETIEDGIDDFVTSKKHKIYEDDDD